MLRPAPFLMNVALAASAALSGCASTSNETTSDGAVLVAHLGRPTGDAAGARAIRTALGSSNPGYDLAVHRNTRHVPAAPAYRVVFVEEPTAGQWTVPARAGAISSDIGGGDIVLLEPGVALVAADPLDFVVFDVPAPFPRDVPVFIRPDWDDRITDTPGGCATETGAYRRILLTWLSENGPYVYHALNAHRVRITDSFSHYHPVHGGFDEMYLVQMVQPGARLIVSRHTDRIEHPDDVAADDVDGLLETYPLEVGDLVYIPRGVVHRGLGGALVQVITIPGFRPGAEIGVDHHLRAINERLTLAGGAALPYNRAASNGPVVK